MEWSLALQSLRSPFPPVAANLGHASLYPNGLAIPLAALDSIWTPPSTFVSITPPSICQTQGSANGCVSNSVVARRVTYQDCGDPWVLCACNGTGAITLDDLTARIARIPTGLRSYIAGAMAVPGSTPDASNTNNFITFKGTPPATLVFNSAAHSLDQGASASVDWAYALGIDTCVADSFANNDLAESFAQAQVIYSYIDLHGNIGVDTSCMKKQLDHFLYNPPVREDQFTYACYPEKRPYYL